MSWFDECDLEYLIGDLKDENAKLSNEVELTKRMYAKVSEDLCAEQADNERLRQELAICEESEQEKCIEYLRQENIDWEDRYRTLASESAKLRELVAEACKQLGGAWVRCTELREMCADLYAEMLTYSNAPTYNASVWSAKLRELGVEVDG